MPPQTLEIIRHLEVFVLENGKVGRAFLKQVGLEKPLSAFRYFELNKHTQREELDEFLLPALEEGLDIGLLSDAGCPGVADPGANLVDRAYRHGLQVVPLVGPSSLLLALMASGMNGQRFSFQGYLSAKRQQLAGELKKLERESRQQNATQIWIETPYRNMAMLEEALKALSPNTQFAVAADLTLPTQFTASHPIAKWRKMELPELHKRPAVFLLLSR